jgi:hypothetical protein
MKKTSTVRVNGNMIFKGHKPTIAVDLGDHWSCYCVLDEGENHSGTERGELLAFMPGMHFRAHPFPFAYCPWNKYEVALEQRQHHAPLVTSRNDPQTNRTRSL